MHKFNILNRSLDIWEAENLSEEEARKKLMELELKELKKPFGDWRYEYEIKRNI